MLKITLGHQLSYKIFLVSKTTPLCKIYLVQGRLELLEKAAACNTGFSRAKMIFLFYNSYIHVYLAQGEQIQIYDYPRLLKKFFEDQGSMREHITQVLSNW